MRQKANLMVNINYSKQFIIKGIEGMVGVLNVTLYRSLKERI